MPWDATQFGGEPARANLTSQLIGLETWSANRHSAWQNSPVCAENLIRIDLAENRLTSAPMVALLCFFWCCWPRLSSRGADLRQRMPRSGGQLIVLQRKVPGRVQFTNSDRLFFIELYRWVPSILKVHHDHPARTLVRWHRAGFRRYWRWKSRSLARRTCGGPCKPTHATTTKSEARRSLDKDAPRWAASPVRRESSSLVQTRVVWWITALIPDPTGAPPMGHAPTFEEARRVQEHWFKVWKRAPA